MKSRSVSDVPSINRCKAEIRDAIIQQNDAAEEVTLAWDNDKLVVEYALRDVAKPIGVSEWRTRLVATLPKGLRGSLPSVKEIERELS